MQIINFLRDYWQYFSIAIVIVLDVLLLFIRKNKTKIIDGNCYDLIIKLILEAEKLFKSGDDKLNYVVDNFLATRPYLNSNHRTAVIGLVENVLRTPQKKGAKDGAKK